jgi:hypothetical protein
MPKQQLTAYRIANNALSASDLPTRLKLLEFGVNVTTKGDVVLGDKTLSLFSSNQKTLGFDRVAIDFEHNTVEGTPAYKESKEPRDVAAYGTPELVPGEGLFLGNITWTPIGLEKARNFHDQGGRSRVLTLRRSLPQWSGGWSHFFYRSGKSQTRNRNPKTKQPHD